MTHFVGPSLEDRVYQGTNALQVQGFGRESFSLEAVAFLQQSFRVNVSEDRLGT